MLRPATPLTVLYALAFILLMLSTVSTPVIQAIPLAEYKGITFGVFGFCDNGECSGFKVGYQTDGLFSANDEEDFSLPSDTRRSLSSLLIVHPVAALMTLVCLSLAAAAHFHAPSHSPRYLLALLILSFPTLLVSLLAFLVDLLLFVPHLRWGGWIVLAATLLITACGVVTCAMRRMLVSRRARQRRIAENAEMNGENYYAARAALAQPGTPPAIAGTASGVSTLDSHHNFRSFEDQTPLTDLSQSSNSDGGAQKSAGILSEESLPERLRIGRPPPGRELSQDPYGRFGQNQPTYGSSYPHEGLIPVHPQEGLIPVQPHEGLIPVQSHEGLIPVQPHEGLIPVQPHEGLIPARPHEGLIPARPHEGLIPWRPHEGLIPVQQRSNGHMPRLRGPGPIPNRGRGGRYPSRGGYAPRGGYGYAC